MHDSRRNRRIRLDAKDRRGICCAGNWIIDHVKTIDTWPAEETLANIVEEEIGTGGAPYNVSVDLSRFDVDVPLFALGLVGDDADGQLILSDLQARGIDASRIRKVPDHPTAYTDVMNVRSTGRRTFFHNRGANALLGPDDFDVGGLTCRVLSLGYLLLLDTLDGEDPEFGTRAARVLAEARSAGISTAVDVVSEHSDRFARVVVPSLAQCDHLIINEFEAGRTCGIDLSPGGTLDRSAVEAAAEQLIGYGVSQMVAIHTPEASFARTRDGAAVWRPTLEIPDGFIVGSAGAGDAFFAGMLLGIHEGWELGESLEFANAAAASSLRHPTCTGGVGTVREIETLAREYPLRA